MLTITNTIQGWYSLRAWDKDPVTAELIHQIQRQLGESAGPETSGTDNLVLTLDAPVDYWRDQLSHAPYERMGYTPGGQALLGLFKQAQAQVDAR